MQPNGNRARGEMDARSEIFFVYQTPNIAALAALANTQNSIPFDQDSVFVWQKMAVFADIAGAAQTDSTRVLPLVTVLITDSGSSQGFSNAPVPLPSIMGDGRLPFVLPAPQLVKPNTTLQFSYSSFAAATIYANLRIQLIGIKRFISPGQG